MEVLEAIKTRRSIRKYRAETVPEDKLEKVLDAGRWAPSAHNSQTWKFIVLRDPGIRDSIAGLLRWGRFLAQAPMGIAVVVDPRATNHPLEDGALAAYSMMLAAHSLGLGTCWVDPSASEEIVKPMLGIGAEEKLICILSIGYADEAPSRTRKELKDIVFTNRKQSTRS